MPNLRADAAENLRTRRNQDATFRLHVHHVRARIHGAQRSIDVERVHRGDLRETLANNNLEDVTSQMTMTLVRELDFLADLVASSGTAEEATDKMLPFLRAFQMSVRFVPPVEVPQADHIRWYDYSARVVRRTIRDSVPGMLAGNFPDNRLIQLYFASDLGPVEVSFGRRRVTAASAALLSVDEGRRRWPSNPARCR